MYFAEWKKINKIRITTVNGVRNFRVSKPGRAHDEATFRVSNSGILTKMKFSIVTRDFYFRVS